MNRYLTGFVLIIVSLRAGAQEDSLENERLSKMIQLTEVVVRNNLDVHSFIQRVRTDTSFYKAFRNLRILSFTSLNDIRMFDKKGKQLASLSSKTRQTAKGGCRTMETLSQQVTGNFFERDGDYRYYTAELYASLFFTEGKICGEHNIVKGIYREVKNKKGIDKHREQLKMLFFDPGKKISGIPLMGDKMAIFDKQHADDYDFLIDLADYEGRSCYVFSVKAKPGVGGRVVIDNMITWFDSKTMEIVARNYDLSYKAGIYDFDVQIEVLISRFQELLVPKVLRYRGSWDIAFKKRERAAFAATLFDFSW